MRARVQQDSLSVGAYQGLGACHQGKVRACRRARGGRAGGGPPSQVSEALSCSLEAGRALKCLARTGHVALSNRSSP